MPVANYRRHQTFASHLSDEVLQACLKELVNESELGDYIDANSPIRELAAKIKEQTRCVRWESMRLARDSIYRETAMRWIEICEERAQT